MVNVAIIGSQGVPANYGGFESLVENLIGENDSDAVRYTVFCGGKDYKEHIREYKGARLRYVPLHANGMQSTPYDILSMISCIGKGYDDILILGVSGCLFLPVFRLFYHKRIIVNIDGLEHRRAKWGRFARWFLRTSESVAVRWADVVVADNKGIQDYVRQTYGKDAVLIAYGGDHAIRKVSDEFRSSVLSGYGLKAGSYAVSVCRIEPENNSAMILEAFAGSGWKLVFIGNWDRSEYGRELKRRYGGYGNIQMLDPVYDLDILYVLRSNAFIYVHGHSAGGTNPSLVEAMQYGIPIAAFDVVYNRATTGSGALYFKSSDELRNILSDNSSFEACGLEMAGIAGSEYVWKVIADRYEKLF